jgi:TolC family type I secretion outer membrane protein
MIDRAAKAAALAAALGALACVPAAAQTANAEPGDPAFVGPTQSEAEEARAAALRAAAAAPDIDFSQPVAGLEDAILRAYWHNPQVLAERARKRSVDFRLPQARALYGPRIDYQVDYGYRRDRIELQPDRFRTASGWSGTVSAIVDQPLFTFGRLSANERRAKAEIGFQRESLRYAEQEVIFRAIDAYVALLRDRNAVRIAQDNLDLLTGELRDNELRQAAGEATIVDRRQVETRRELAAAELAIARGNLASSEGRFLAVIGSPPADELAPPNPLLQPVPTLADALEVALAENPVVEAAEYREQISRAAIDAAISERLPRVDLRGRADLAPVSPYDDELRQTTYLAQVVLSGPLFTSGLLAARQNEAEAANDADWRLVDAARRDLIDELTAAWNSRQASGDSLGSYAAAVDAARSAYEGAVEQQRAGFRTTLDVLTLARDLLTVRNNLNMTEADHYIAQARILFALGMLDLPDLMPSEPAYDAGAHLEKVDGQGSVFPITPILRALDGISYVGTEPRPTRDPAIDGLEAEGQ